MSAPTARRSLLAGSGPARATPRSAATAVAVGAVEIALGIVAIVWPAVADVSIAVLIGWLFLAEGVVALVSAYHTHGPKLVARLVLGAVGVLAGIYLITNPDEGLLGLTAVLVIVLFLAGLSSVATGLLGDDENRGALIAGGALDIVLGALIWAKLPSSAAWAIGLLVGIHFIALGFATASEGLALRRRSLQGRVGEEAIARNG